jgi:hypothetical protein
MELSLNHAQRINLHALLGAQRGPTLDDTRAFWRLQDMIDLTAEEKKLIDYKVVPLQGAGVSAPQWDMVKSGQVTPRSFEFTSDQATRIERAIKEWQPGFFASMDRAWLEPLLAQFENGQGSEETKKLRRAK